MERRRPHGPLVRRSALPQHGVLRFAELARRDLVRDGAAIRADAPGDHGPRADRRRAARARPGSAATASDRSSSARRCAPPTATCSASSSSAPSRPACRPRRHGGRDPRAGRPGRPAAPVRPLPRRSAGWPPPRRTSLEELARAVDFVEVHNARAVGRANAQAAELRRGARTAAESPRRDAHSPDGGRRRLHRAGRTVLDAPPSCCALLPSAADLVIGRASYYVRLLTPFAKLVQRAARQPHGSGRCRSPRGRAIVTDGASTAADDRRGALPPAAARSVIDYPLVQEGRRAPPPSLSSRLRDPRTIISIVLPILVLLLVFAATAGTSTSTACRGSITAGQPVAAAGAVGVYYLGFPLRGYRWALLLRGAGITISRARLDGDHLHQLAGQLPRARPSSATSTAPTCCG